MKRSLLLAAAMFFGKAQASEHEHANPFSPEQEEIFFSKQEKGVQAKGIYPYLFWNECQKVGPEGNYSGHPCHRKRRISEILYEFIEIHLSQCIEEAAHLLDHSMESFKITHDGIFADPNHSPRSLHAEGRAIDIAAITITTSLKEKVRLGFAKLGKGRFYNSLRACWGLSLATFNGCPYSSGAANRTGSIGKEDRRHQNHLHLSVPVCHNGRHIGNLFRK